jgi:hypothetical protein
MAQHEDKDFIRVSEREKQPSMLGCNEFISWFKDRLAQIESKILKGQT